MVATRLTPPLRAALSAAPAYLERHGRPEHPRDLLAHKCIRYRFISANRIADWQFREDGQTFTVDPAASLVFDSFQSVVQAAREGLRHWLVAARRYRTGPQCTEHCRRYSTPMPSNTRRSSCTTRAQPASRPVAPVHRFPERKTDRLTTHFRFPDSGWKKTRTGISVRVFLVCAVSRRSGMFFVLRLFVNR